MFLAVQVTLEVLNTTSNEAYVQVICSTSYDNPEDIKFTFQSTPYYKFPSIACNSTIRLANLMPSKKYQVTATWKLCNYNKIAGIISTASKQIETYQIIIIGIGSSFVTIVAFLLVLLMYCVIKKKTLSEQQV